MLWLAYAAAALLACAAPFFLYGLLVRLIVDCTPFLKAKLWVARKLCWPLRLFVERHDLDLMVRILVMRHYGPPEVRGVYRLLWKRVTGKAEPKNGVGAQEPE